MVLVIWLIVHLSQHSFCLAVTNCSVGPLLLRSSSLCPQIDGFIAAIFHRIGFKDIAFSLEVTTTKAVVHTLIWCNNKNLLLLSHLGQWDTGTGQLSLGFVVFFGALKVYYKDCF